MIGFVNVFGGNIGFFEGVIFFVIFFLVGVVVLMFFLDIYYIILCVLIDSYDIFLSGFLMIGDMVY